MVKSILKFKHRRELKEVYGLYVTKGALDHYRSDVNGNSSELKITLINKLRRNFVLGKLVRENKDKNIKIKSYGNLYIIANENRIVKVENLKGYHKFDIDENKKKALDILLGLKESNTYGK